ncbi:MAG TPA: zf-HC2 domain-containing protein, partial [Acidimicrobiales bacterium]|nr:zf-HC2 domain-containing protein [Acidimicrobiales bacterium]
MTEHQLRCDDVREVAPDIALGLLTGEERADALAHLERCEGCRAEVASLAVAADEVLLAAPEAAPPPGFADRV